MMALWSVRLRPSSLCGVCPIGSLACVGRELRWRGEGEGGVFNVSHEQLR